MLLLAATSVHARPVAISKSFETDKKLSAGVMLGVPTGLSLEYMLTPTLAVDLGVGAYLLYRERDGFHVHGDLLWHPFVAVDGVSFQAPLYVGVGARFLRHDGITHLGVRAPVGISFVFNKTPVEVFMEGALVVDFSVSEPDQGAVDVNGLVGLRYFFR